MKEKNRDHLVEELRAEIERLTEENKNLRLEVVELHFQLSECEEHNYLSYSGED